MTKNVFLLILGAALTAVSVRVQAQGYFNRAEEGQIKIGIRGGVNYFNLGSLNVFDDQDLEGIEFFENRKLTTKHKIGFQIGAYADIWMSPMFSFMPELNLIRKGGTLDEQIEFEIDDPDDPGNPLFTMSFPFKLNTDLYYVESPLLLGLKPAPSLTLFAGPQLSYLVFHKSALSGSEEMEDDEYIGTEGLEKFQIGAAAGIKFDFSPNINISARYATDFQSAFKKDENAPKMRNAGFSFSVGYSF